MMRKKSIASVIVLGLVLPCWGATITVDDDGPADFNNIQAAVDAAQPSDTVLVADGVYTGEGNRDIRYNGKAITVKSANGPASCVIDCEDQDQAFYFSQSESSAAVLEGFTITGGNQSYGGAIRCGNNASPTINNCIMKENYSGYAGGALYCENNAGPLLSGCRLIDNHGHYGGAVYCGSYSSPVFVDCIIQGNSAEWRGGALYCENSSFCTMDRCTIEGNSAQNDGGAVSTSSDCSLTVSNCSIQNNLAGDEGGALYLYRCAATITNTVFSGNRAEDRAGAVYSYYGPVILVNCTFVANEAGYRGGGVYCRYDPPPIIANCIFVNNTEHAVYRSYSNDYPIVTHCIFHANPQGDYFDDWYYESHTGSAQINSLPNASNNLSGDPFFAFSHDYHITADSLCIDRGTNNPPAELPQTDKDGNPRRLGGSPAAFETVDIGAYEYNYDAPSIAVSAQDMEFIREPNGTEPADQILHIRNCGGGQLNWQLSEDCDWLSVDPNAGSAHIQPGQSTVRVDTADLPRGIYRCDLTVADPNAINSPRNVRVTLRIKGRLHVPADYATISLAVEDAMDGETIEVQAGTYPERIELDKSLLLVGVGQPVIDVNDIGGDAVRIVADDCTLDGFELINGNMGLDVRSMGNVIRNNTILANRNGVRLYNDSSLNLLANNVIADCAETGLHIRYSANNTLRDNHISACAVNFHIEANSLEQYTQDIDISNTVDEKPIYYVVGMDDVFIGEQSNAGCVVAVDCTDIIIEGIEVSGNAYGVLFAYTQYSVVEDAVISDNSVAGVRLHHSPYNGISNNTISGNDWGVLLDASAETFMRGNVLAQNSYGVNCTGAEEDYVQDIDTSNVINSKPVYYLVDAVEAVVDANSGAACVFAVNCRDLTISDLELSGNGSGITLVNTTHSVIDNVICKRNNTAGIRLFHAEHNTVNRSALTENPVGLQIEYSNHTTCNANTVYANDQGINLRYSNANILQCIVRGNAPQGGIYVYGYDRTVMIMNTTIFGNARGNYGDYVYPEGGGISVDWGTNVTVSNCIIWGNSPKQIAEESHFTITYSDVQGGIQDADAEGIISMPPMLTGDGHLRAGSPCINVGDPSPRYRGTDIDGEFRVYDRRIDLGADEFSDGDDDGMPDWYEKTYFDPNGLAGDPQQDPDGDGHANLDEYELYASDPTAAGRTLYVDSASPDDSNDGLSWQTAKKTISAAIAETDNGDRVVIAAGYYREDVSPAGRQIVIQSRDPYSPLTAASTIIGGMVSFQRGELEGCSLKGLTVSNPNGSGLVCRASSPTISDCVILANRSHSSSMGGGLTCMGASPGLSRCIINGNIGYYRGGAIHATNSVLNATNCVMAGNMGRYSGDHGSGIYLVDSDLKLHQCTVADSHYPDGYSTYGSAIHCERSDLEVHNCILWNLMDRQINSDDISTVQVDYSNVMGGAQAISADWAGSGNITVDPCFVDPGRWTRPPNYSDSYWVDGDYHLRSAGWRWTPYLSHGSHWVWDGTTSYCIDAGNPGMALGAEAVSVPHDPNGTWGRNVRVNMGAYGGTAEASMAPPGTCLLGDLNNDGKVHYDDLGRLMRSVRTYAQGMPTDLDHNSRIDKKDISLLMRDWLKQTPWHGIVTPFARTRQDDASAEPPQSGDSGQADIGGGSSAGTVR